MSSLQRVAIIGGGLCGLSCAIRLAQQNVHIDLFEAAPVAGGRTRSFFDSHVHQWVDNGPHLLAGAYRHTCQLLQEASAEQHIHWQSSLQLPLWDLQRGHFQLAPPAYLPFALAMPWACLHLPGHHADSANALLRIAMANRKRVPEYTTVYDWFQQMDIPQTLMHDLLEPLCLGIMNESINTANAMSFSRVLREAFANHASARLGWFTQPLSKALIEPLVRLAESYGVHMHTGTCIRTLDICHTYHVVVIALPSRARNRLLNIREDVETRCISNVHLWLEDMEALPTSLVGSLNTSSQWFFDVSQQMQNKEASPYRHICAVISADSLVVSRKQRVSEVCRDLQHITGRKTAIQPAHIRMVREIHATTQVRPRAATTYMHKNIIDATEAPLPGDFPATIEAAVMRGEQAAKHCHTLLKA